MKRGNKVSKQEVQAADKRFVEKVKQSRGDNPVFAALIPPVFKAKEIAENTGVLSHTAFFDPAKTGGSVMSDFKIKSMSKKLMLVLLFTGALVATHFAFLRIPQNFLGFCLQTISS